MLLGLMSFSNRSRMDGKEHCDAGGRAAGAGCSCLGFAAKVSRRLLLCDKQCHIIVGHRVQTCMLKA